MSYTDDKREASETIYDTRYQYEPTPTIFVKESPEEYIIPDCLEACKILWAKGIDTFQCSNEDDPNYRYIDIETVGMSDENLDFLYDKINSGVEGFTIGGVSKRPRIYVNAIGEEASKKLCELASMLSLQDTIEYRTTEEYLDDYKTTDGEYRYDPKTRNLIRDYNPEYANATLSDALTANNDWNLYVEEEGRVYYSQEALQIHLQYLERIKEQPPKIRKSI